MQPQNVALREDSFPVLLVAAPTVTQSVREELQAMSQLRDGGISQSRGRSLHFLRKWQPGPESRRGSGDPPSSQRITARYAAAASEAPEDSARASPPAPEEATPRKAAFPELPACQASEGA